MKEKRNVLVGVTGSVAAIKVGEFIGKLKEAAIENEIQVEIKAVATESARNFFTYSVTDLTLRCEDEFSVWKNIGDDILHISLRQWADLYIILPLTANTLAKLSNGLCDNILVSLIESRFRREVRQSGMLMYLHTYIILAVETGFTILNNVR